MRLTKKVFSDLTLIMMSFGILVGILFPFVVMFLGIPREYVMTVTFIIPCIAAGLVVGWVNIVIARAVVGRRLKLLASRMQFITSKLSSGLDSKELAECTRDNCIIPVDSDDEIGESAKAFNDLVHSLSMSMTNEIAIREFNELLSRFLDLDKLAGNALSKIMEHMGAGAGALIIEKGGELRIAASRNIRDPDRLVKNDSVWDVMVKKKGVIISLDDEVVVETPFVSFIPKETLIEPLIYKELPVGIIILTASTGFGSDHAYALEMFLKGLALAMRNSVTYEQLQTLASNDPLTGMFNRRFGLLRLDEEFSRSVRSNLPLGVIMFDIDHFKLVNDTYGHTVGDRVLVNIARISRLAIREGDFMIRYGGEEFLVILPGASSDDTLFVAERLRHMVEESIVRHNQLDVRVTISAGFTAFPESDVTDEMALIRNADAALYSAKAGGRNMVVNFQPGQD